MGDAIIKPFKPIKSLKYMKKIFLLIIFLLVTVFPAQAETVWQVAPGRSKIKFKVKHLVFLEVEGRFKKFQGQVVTPKETFVDSKMEMKINVDSIYTGIDDRDKHLLSEDFFNNEEFPEITFTSHSVEKLDGKDIKGRYKISGDLTMRGVTKPIVLDAVCDRIKILPNGKTRIDLKAKGSVNRFDFKLEWNELVEKSRAIVGENVDIDLKIALLN